MGATPTRASGSSFKLLLLPIAVIGLAEVIGLTCIASILNERQLANVRGVAVENSSQQQQLSHPYQYSPSPLEQYFMRNARSLDLYNPQGGATCPLLYNDTSPINPSVLRYFSELSAYNAAVRNFSPIEYDLRTKLLPDGSNVDQVCSVAKIHPDGIEGIFVDSAEL